MAADAQDGRRAAQSREQERNLIVQAPNGLARRVLLGAGAAALTGTAQSAAQSGGSINDRLSGDISPVHDPCIIAQDGTYYVFCTTGSSETEGGGFVACRRSRDLLNWERVNYVFPEIPPWAREAVPRTRGIWAPDISFFNNRYHLYYSVSSFGSNHSVIGLATNATLDPDAPDFRWDDQGVVVASQRFNNYNCIDANLLADRDGGYWLSWGSFWTGLKMARIDPATGKRPADDGEIHNLARRNRPGAVEAPFIIAHGEFYYLFASFDFCCRGADSTYFVVCGRSENVLGPYLDVNGVSMLEGGGSIVIQANDRFKGPGHNAVLQANGRDFLVYHAYDAQNGGVPTLRISEIYWTPDGWPRAVL